jgi:hypothetical protein
MLEQALTALVDRLDRLMGFNFDLNKDPGRGNLNLRAYVAAVLGPRRIAHGNRATKQVPWTESVLLATNQPNGQEAMYVEVWVPQSGDEGPVAEAVVRFSGGEGVGTTGVVEILRATHTVRYSCVLLPGEQLYAQALRAIDFTPAIVSPTPIPVIVAKVSF